MKKALKIILYSFGIIIAVANVIGFIMIGYFGFKSSFEHNYMYIKEEIYLNNDCFVFEDNLYIIKKIGQNRLMKVEDGKEIDVAEIFKNKYFPNKIIDFYVFGDQIVLITTFGIIKLDSNLNIVDKYEIGYYNSDNDYFKTVDSLMNDELIYICIENNNILKLLVIDYSFSVVEEGDLDENILKKYELYLIDDNKISKTPKFDISINNCELSINGKIYQDLNVLGNKIFKEIYIGKNKIYFSTFLQKEDALASIYEGIHNFDNYQLWEYNLDDYSLSCIKKFEKGAVLISFNADSYQYYYDGGLYSNDVMISSCKNLSPLTIQYESEKDINLNYRMVFYVTYNNGKFYYSYDYDVSIYEV